MGFQNKTREELIKELQKMQDRYDSLAISYTKDNAHRKKAEDLLKTVISNAPITIFATDEKGIFILNDGKGLENVGMKPGDNVGVSAYELFSDLEVIENDGKVIDGKSVLDRILCGESLSGITKLNNIVFGNIFTPIHDATGKVSGMIGVATDITERKKAEDALKDSVEIYRLLFENSGEAILLTDPYGTVYSANPEATRIFGRSEQEICRLGRNCIMDLNDPHLSAALNERNQTGKFKGILNLKRKDGTIFPAEVISNIFYDYAGNERTSMIIRDISEQEKSEESVRESSHYARNLIEVSPDPLVTISKDGKITDVNRATERITGINRNTIIGTDFVDYFTEPDKARKGYKIVFSKGVVKDYPLTIRHISGRKIDVLYNASVYKNEAGEVQGVFAAARDITDRKGMEDELRNSKDLLEKLNQHLLDIRENERSQIALNLHDDFGQRLTALNLDIAWLKSRMGVQSAGVKKKLVEMSLMISESIDSIREISSFLRPAILYELGLVPAFEWQLKKFKKQSGIDFRFNHDPEINKIDDQISLILFRILQESLTNIIRHSDASVVQIDLRNPKKNIKLIIKDNGKGIDDEKINSMSSMGITGMIERIRSVNGKIQIRGIKSKGTVLNISIPLTILKP